VHEAEGSLLTAAMLSVTAPGDVPASVEIVK
jgi:hypothetical protein